MSDNIFKEWYEQFKKPWSSLSFWGYFIGFIVLVGSMGIFFSIYHFFQGTNESWSIVENMITYSIALTMPACVLVFESFPKSSKKVSLIVFTLLLFVLLPLVLSLLTYVFHCALLAGFCVILSWCIWVIANHNNVDLHDDAYEDSIKKNAKNNSSNWD